MNLQFTKMHGLGNDFMVINGITQDVTLSQEQIQQLADRHFGIGFDQLLLVESPRSNDIDFTYRIFNADGGEVEQCGNGARCFAIFVRQQGLTSKSVIRVETASGVITLNVSNDDQVTVDMGVPEFNPGLIPFEAEQAGLSYTLELDSTQISIGAVSMGNPHAVTVVDDISSAPVTEWGPQIEHHPRFPQRVNAGFMQVVDRRHIQLRVFERGSGETLACGTGACAAMVIGHQQGLLDDEVRVSLPGGDLHIAWQGPSHPVMMTGPATTVFEGTIKL